MDAYLDTSGPLEVDFDTREELITKTWMSGELLWDPESLHFEPTQKALDILALVESRNG